MRKLFLFSAVLLIMASSGTTFAQNLMQIFPASGSPSSYEVNNIRKQTFTDGKMIIEFKDATSPVEIEFTERYKVVYGIPSLVEDMSNLPLEATLFPIPVNNDLFIRIPATSDASIVVSIFSISGQMLMSEKHSASPGSNQFIIPVSSLSSGFYFCNISDGQQTNTQKFIKE